LREQRIYCDKGAHHNSPIILPHLEVGVHWQTGSWMLNVIHVMIVGIEGGKNLMQMLTYPGDGYGCRSSIRGSMSGGECLSSPCPTLLDEAVPGLGFTGGGASFERIEE
jgi:hypothetical protein